MAPNTELQEHVAVPHELAIAHVKLRDTLDSSIDVYQHNLEFPDAAHVIAAIDRFVHELASTPKWLAELRRRAYLIKLSCRSGSPYAVARERALNSYRETPPELWRGKLAIERLRGSTKDRPNTLIAVIEARRDVNAILQMNGVLSPDARRAFADWRDACRAVQLDADRLAVDGCQYLHHIYRADRSNRSQNWKAMLQTAMGGASLETIRDAADSIVGWIKSQIVDSGKTKREGGQRQPNPREKVVDEAMGRGKASDDAKSLICGVLSKHHGYEPGEPPSCTNQEPIRVREMARRVDASPATVSRVIKTEFGGHKEYTRRCHDGTIAHALAILRGDVRPSILANQLRADA